jgi:RimJ/RimL family protein N-acetyltransferase
MIAINQTYPSQWERHLVLGDARRVFARPIRPDDEPLFLQMLQHVSSEDLRLRFFDSIRQFTRPFLAQLTQIDYARAMAFIALDETSGEALGVVRVHFDLISNSGEYAILLGSDLKGHGLGWSLMQMMIDYAKTQGLKRIVGQILRENSVMLSMCRELGFKVKADADDRGLCDVTLALDSSVGGE